MKIWSLTNLTSIFSEFKIPLLILFGILVAIFSQYFLQLIPITDVIYAIIITIGGLNLLRDVLYSIRQKKFALDYIAILAIIVGIISHEFLVAAIIILMLSGGKSLENFGMSRAKKSLIALSNRIPNSVYLWEKNAIGKKISLDKVGIGAQIAVRKGEVIPLDGTLETVEGLTDESSLTGEPYIIDKIKGDLLRSGTINIGDVIVIKVTKAEKDSTYRKIIEMVKEAQKEKAPLIRLADRYSTFFTLITLIIAGATFLISHNFSSVLAVLVIATPCPLILATPIALMGGMNAAAKRRIIIKRMSSIETLSRVDTVVFDKTGTITLGRPFVKNIDIIDKSYTHEEIHSIAEAIERNSLHPLAKAIVEQAKKEKHLLKQATNVSEKIGSGISGLVDGISYTLAKIKDYKGMAMQMLKDKKRVAIIEFEDKIKKESGEIIKELKKLGLALFIYTGDKKEAAVDIINKLGEAVTIHAECSPEDKKNGIRALKKEGKTTAMVGDGINDAPALAVADVGMVFSNEEHTAASEAADVVFLGGDFSLVTNVISLSKKTIHIALESITFGMGASIFGMILASFGLIPPVAGAFIQEAIDVLVIINALRASR